MVIGMFIFDILEEDEKNKIKINKKKTSIFSKYSETCPPFLNCNDYTNLSEMEEV